MKVKKDFAEKNDSKDDKSVMFFIAALVFIILVIAGILSLKYLYKPKQKIQSYSYNGFIFTNFSGLWYVEVQKLGTANVFSVPLHYGPRQLENVTVNGNVKEFLKNNYSYITFDPDKENLSYVALSASEISIKLARLFNKMPIAACTKNITDACKNRPIVDCNSRFPVIYIKEEGNPAIVVKNTCITITGEKEGLLMATDRLFLGWLGIMH